MAYSLGCGIGAPGWEEKSFTCSFGIKINKLGLYLKIKTDKKKSCLFSEMNYFYNGNQLYLGVTLKASFSAGDVNNDTYK